jgi:hypothetical protein
MAKYAAEPQDGVREMSAKMALQIEQIIEERKIRDWATNEDAIKRIEDAIDDYLVEAPAEYGFRLDTADIDLILRGTLGVARKLAGR